MTSEAIQERLKTIVKPYINNQENFEKLSKESDFINDLEINSANLVDIVLDVEDEFDIRIENDDMEKMTNVEATVEVIQKKLSAK
ncbi:acyl carrier protein [Psychroflexus lacisalsi]|jgi:acyl carrier protein|uniref:Acyl carrier protein n=1 Tax=Psychroflexus lacisalsi TaxID=503928 RepID=A0ABN1K7A5_9FLAO|nr:phosphopantetheine-binding protein [Psychroflexus lacisalsi]MBZ9619410.1 phosphopantetheine-binding protein [Psychroflexus lacisalsi]